MTATASRLHIPFVTLRDWAVDALRAGPVPEKPGLPPHRKRFRASVVRRGDGDHLYFAPDRWQDADVRGLLRGHLAFADHVHLMMAQLELLWPRPDLCVVIGIGGDRGRTLATRADGPEIEPVEIVPAGRVQRLADLQTDPDLRSRAIGVWGLDGQLAYEGLRVGVVGCGGLGSVVAHQLAADGVRQITLVDPQTVARSDLGRSAAGLLTEGMVGSNKAESLADGLRFTFDSCSPRAIASSIENPRVVEALQECDLLVDATDNFGARRLVSRVAVAYHVPVVSVGSGAFRQRRGLALGCETAFVLPGDGCLACRLGLPLQSGGFEFGEGRAGSLRSLNLWATAWAMRAIEEWIMGRLTASRAVRTTWTREGREVLREIRRDPAVCQCGMAGLGDLAF